MKKTIDTMLVLATPGHPFDSRELDERTSP